MFNIYICMVFVYIKIMSVPTKCHVSESETVERY